MTPAPSPASSSVVPQGPAALSRTGSSAIRGPSAPGTSRAQAATRADRAATGQGRRGGDGFATVLAAVQEDERAGGVQEAGPAGPACAARPDTEAERASASEAPVHEAPAALSDVSAAPPQTPWLLLAFGSGTVARGGSGDDVTLRLQEPGPDDIPAGTDTRDLPTETMPGLTSGVAAVPEAMPDQLAGLPAAPSVGAPSHASIAPRGALAPSTPTDVAASGAVVAATQRPVSTGAASAAVSEPDGQLAPDALFAAGPDVVTRQDMPSRRDLIPADNAALQAQGSSTDRLMVATGSDLGETSQRVRAAVLGVSGTPPADPPPPTDVQMAPVPGASPAAARAATLLAHALGQPGPAGDVGRADSVRSLASEVLATVPSTGQPAVRATEALLRFAQSGVGPSRAASDADGAVPFGLAAATAPVVPVLHDLSPSTPATAVPLPPAVGDQVLHQVVSSLKMQWKDGIGEAKLHLRPDALGAVSVSLRVEAGAVTAVVRADSPQVQEWVVQHQQTLRQQMEAAGLRLDELVVTPDDQPQNGRQKEAPPEQRRRQPAAPAADTPTFEQLL